MNPLKIEVTEAMREAAAKAIADKVGHGMREKCETQATAALAAAFQHPEFIAQIRRQVVGCVPEDAKQIGENEFTIAAGGVTAHCTTACGIGYNIANNRTRASLGRLLGEEA